MIPPLCIVQARHHSTRLLGKMLLFLNDPRRPAETLIGRGHRIACEAFGASHVVVAIPRADASGPLGDELRRLKASIFAWDGPEADVLGRFYHCAHAYRWHPDSVLVRYTPDDPFKSVDGLRRVAAGERLPVEVGGEAFTLGMLDAAYQRTDWLVGTDPLPGTEREHLTHALFPVAPPPCPPGCWTVDTPEDLGRARERLEREMVEAGYCG